jgi:hypothetical protein
MPDHLDEVFDRLSEVDHCEYCGAVASTRPDPFAQQAACKLCWDQIVGGE